MSKTLRQMSKSLKQRLLMVFRRDECGATMIEYSLLIGLISAVIIAAILVVKNFIALRWEVLVDALSLVIL